MLSVLVVSPNPSVPGGVSVFIECMKRHIKGSQVVSFYVGSSGLGDESRLSTLARLFRGPFELARVVKRQKFDVVHINPSFDSKSIVRDSLFLLALRLVGFRRILFYFHGWDFGLQSRLLNQPLLRRCLAWILNRAALITVLGHEFRDGLVALGVDPDRIVLTQTMFEGAELSASSNDTVPAARRFILFMSRFDRQKGGRELLDAFAALSRDYPDLDLVMAGDGEDKDAFHEQVGRLGLAGRVRFVGYVTGDEKWTLLRACTIFALPTYYRSEGMPVVVLEAMGAGKPLLVGSAGALTTIVSDPANGVVLPQVTAQNIEYGLRRLLMDPARLLAIGQSNFESAWSRFEAQNVTAEIETYYQRVAQC